jgi:O-antigen/teichoic acid export membrane protein
MVAAYPILKLWVGSNYAINSMQYLRILVLANIIRHLCAPYATMVVATAKQKVATTAAITEALVNLGASIWFAIHFGAMGVAMGTLVGSFAGVAMHFAVSMNFTRNILASRLKLFLGGMLRPSAMAIPSLVLLRKWWLVGSPEISLPLWFAWGGSTLFIAWLMSLDRNDRDQLTRLTGLRTKLT